MGSALHQQRHRSRLSAGLLGTDVLSGESVGALKQVRAVLLDIEGTTTPIEFVHRTLFGFARPRVGDFLRRHWSDPEVRADVERLRAEHSSEASSPDPPPWRDDVHAVAAYALWLMDRDRKSTGLKSLQGKIWDQGYRSGELRGEVYPDVPVALERWSGQGMDVAIFSSGSVQAQKLLFQSTPAGDLTRFIRGYFDTTTGPKNEPRSYARIAEALAHPAGEVLFISDVPTELDAARATGMQTALCVRATDARPDPGTHFVIHTFDEVFG